jgi:hypothetical protein
MADHHSSEQVNVDPIPNSTCLVTDWTSSDLGQKAILDVIAQLPSRPLLKDIQKLLSTSQGLELSLSEILDAITVPMSSIGNTVNFSCTLGHTLPNPY